MNTLEIFSRVILANELDGSTAHAYRFSDPDGVRTGKSGWSFGICQFDINNNLQTIICLRECGFTTDEITGLKLHLIANMKPMNAKLLANCTTNHAGNNAAEKPSLSWRRFFNNSAD